MPFHASVRSDFISIRSLSKRRLYFAMSLSPSLVVNTMMLVSFGDSTGERHTQPRTRHVSMIRVAIFVRVRDGSLAHTNGNIETVFIRINHLGLRNESILCCGTYLDASRMRLRFHLLPQTHFQGIMRRMENGRNQPGFRVDRRGKSRVVLPSLVLKLESSFP